MPTEPAAAHRRNRRIPKKRQGKEEIQSGTKQSLTYQQVYALAYANGLAIIVETKKEVERMIKYLNKYFNDKEL